ncbi:MAG: hypothetical protein Kow0090_10330 [Myxococcota bacterium]
MPDGTQERVDLALHRELEIDKPDAVMEPYRVVGYDGKEIDPTDGTVSLSCFKPDGAPISGVTAEIKDKLIHFKADTTGDEWELKEFYHAELTLTKGSDAYYRFFYFDVVVFKLPVLVSQDHFPPDLKAAFGESDFSRLLQLSRAAIMRRIRRHIRLVGHERKRVRAALVRNPENFADAHLNLALAMAYRESIRESGDHFSFLYREYHDLYEESLKQALETLDYDVNEDKKLAGDEKGKKRPPFFRR